ncbi:uncharacterized protein LOC142986022 isoform X1 [Anticarsia gemmatalis]|uniref:uncharacterized protein LOC142986022 isoform X1 n=1 Tax=Anticarsia gemmatalis TaxID=129554 RepID=UPI003F775E40
MLKFVLAVVLLVLADVAYSKFEYREQLEGWIRPFKAAVTYREASQRCHARGSVVASPITADLLKEIKSIISSQKRSSTFYIGTIAKANPPRFESEERVPLSELVSVGVNASVSGEVRALQCLVITAQGDVSAVSCASRLPYICFRKHEPRAVPECDTGYTLLNATTNCYKLHEEAINYDEATATCEREGAYVTVVNHAEEQRAVCLLTSPDAIFYVGLRDVDGQGHWKSIDGEPVEQLFNVWLSGRKPADAEYRHAYLRCATESLNLARRSHTFPVLCEKSPRYVLPH